MARSKYGVTPWGAWFIEVLNGYEMGARLDRGRTYANTGRVLSLTIETGKAIAKVKGNYLPYYRVEIDFPILKEQEQVYRMIEEDPALLARIAAGELPEEFLVKLKAEGISLIPRRWREMKRSCSCPDYGDPCKHMAALYYIIAREVDADPRVLFRLRGVDLEARFGRPMAVSLPAPFTVTAALPAALPEEPGTPPSPVVPPMPLVFGEIPHCAGLITSLLPPAPPFSDRDFALALADFYHQAARFEVWKSASAVDDTGDVEHRFSRSRWAVLCPNPAPGAEPMLQETDIQGNTTAYTLFDAYSRFVNFSSDDGTENYVFLFYLFKFLNLVCRFCAFIPFVLLEKGILKIIWKPYDTLPQIGQVLDALAGLERGMLPLPVTEKPRRRGKKENKVLASGRSVVDLLSSAFLGEWVKQNYFARRTKGGSREYQGLLEIFFQGQGIETASPALRSLPLSIDRWLSVLHIDFSAWKYLFTVKEASRTKRSPPGMVTDEEAPDVPLNFTLSMDLLTETVAGMKRTPLYAVASGKPGNNATGAGKTSKTRSSASAGPEAAGAAETLSLLRAPTALSNYLPEIRTLMTRKTVRLTEERLAAFLESAAPLLTRLGIGVELPKALKRELKPRLVLKSTGSNKKRGSLVSYLELDSLLNWEWQIAVGDRIMDLAEFEKLCRRKQDLIRFRDGFVKLDPEELAKLLKKAGEAPPGINDFLKAHFAGDSILAFDAGEIIQNLFEERRFPPPNALAASLRPYQKRGYNWVCSLLMAGFGCILADDMGLGKTIQSIAALLRLKEEGLLADRCLVVAPAALLENWERELARFAPSLSVSRYHGAGRRLEKERHDVFLTTYQTAVRDASWLEKQTFSLLIVDEAHLMKNADTRISQTVKKLRPRFRLALSGTPVENRLEDLRSLFDFILPGYLGNPVEFKREYRYPIEVLRDTEKAGGLRKITAPFLLRRVKTDKTIIKDLPDKIVTNEYAVLEKEQAALYEGMVAETLDKLERLDPKDRSALILSLLTGLKQICDHPRVYDKESPAVSALSGKALLLLTLLEEILANREKALIFSQYVETLDCLSQIITGELGEPVLVYHGGMSQKSRSETIAAFQNDPASRLLLVSLKAGGLGLNLTAASRVIHYDLWYNPAV
ncbi:MAG: DEAD/DEAH box helicase family protein, partial [Treponema sp.]|nr:DEAD/DEAH box helicase family protein [Treponema sp.]